MHLLSLTYTLCSRLRRFLSAASLLLLTALGTTAGTAAPIGEDVARRVANNFIDYHLAKFGDWRGSPTPSIADIELVETNGVPLFYAVSVAPSGYLLVAYDDDFSPVLLYSPSNRFSRSRVVEEGSLESWIIPETKAVRAHIDAVELNLASAQAKSSGVASKAEIKTQSRSWQSWQFFNREAADFRSQLGLLTQSLEKNGGLGPTAKANKAPLLETSWGQGSSRGPYTYNAKVPSDPGTSTRAGCEHMVTGCVATALGQIMRYHQWPVRGTGSNAYTWRPGSSTETRFEASFTEPYDWANMPVRLTARSSATQTNAVAKLMADLGVALEMDFGCTQSGSFPSKAQSILPRFFRYKTGIEVKGRSDFASSAEFFNLLRAELDATPPRPSLLAIYNAGQAAGHAVVVDGYQTGAQNMVHLNFGWDGSADDTYYDIDSNWTTAAGFYVWVPNGQFVVTKIEPDKTACRVTLADNAVTIASTSTSASLDLTADSTCSWVASADATWLSLPAGGAGTGSGLLRYSAEANPSISARTANVTINNSVFSVTQAGNGCTYDLAQTAVTLASANGESGAVTLSTGAACTWKVSSNASWLSVSNPEGSGGTSIRYTAEPNRTDAARVATLSVAGRSLTVTQPRQCTYSVSPQSLSIGAGSTDGSVVMEAGSGCTWSASSSAQWLTITSGATGSGYGRIEYSIAANTGSAGRTGTLTAGRQTLTINQAGTAVAPSTLVNPGFEDGDLGWEETTLADVPVITYDRPSARSGYWYAWFGGYDDGKDTIKQTVSIPANAAASTLRFWYSIYTAEDTVGIYDTLTLEAFDTSGNKLAELWKASNDDASDDWMQSPPIDLSPYRGKNVVLLFTAKTDGSLPTTFLLDELALTSEQPCTYRLSSEEVVVDSTANEGTISVTTSPDTGCPWRASSSADWVISNSSATGSGTLSFRVGDYLSGAPRLGSIGVGGKTLTVTQSAAPLGGEDTLRNGDFEAGADAWSSASIGGYDTITLQAGLNTFAGRGLLWLGGYDSANDRVAQRFTIPARVTEAKFRFWYRISTQDVAGATAFDNLTVSVVNDAGVTLKTLARFSNANPTANWSPSAIIDMLEFRGQTVTVVFEAITDGSGPTSFFIDNVSLNTLSPLAATQSINFVAVANQTIDSATVDLSASSTVGLPVSFASLTNTICTVPPLATRVTLLATGTCTIQAMQSGNASFAAALPVTRSFAVRASQSINFASLSAAPLTTGSITATATASSGLVVSFATATPAICGISGNTITLLQVGTCTVTASQAGSALIAAAPPVSQSFAVQANPQTITFLAPKAQLFVNQQFVLVATSSANLPVSFASETPAACSVVGSILRFVAPRTCTVTASQAGNATTAAATPVTRNIEITDPPSLRNTALTLASSKNPSGQNEAITLTARVTGRLPVTGSLVFSSIERGVASPMCTVALGAPSGTGDDTSATANCAVPAAFRNQSSHTYAVSYAGDANNTAANASLVQIINNQSARITVTVSPVKPIAGQPVTITATIFGLNPTGTVSFFDQGIAVPGCTQRPVALPGTTPSPLRVATCTIPIGATTVGERFILANYTGDNFNGASSTTFSFAIISALNGPAFDYSDLWWAGIQENGWGMSIQQRGNVQFNALYIYDAAGKPTWAVMPGGTWNSDFTAYSGDLYQAVSSPYFAYTTSHFEASKPIGSATIRYRDRDNATLSYSFTSGPGVGAGTKSLTRQVFSSVDRAGRLFVGGLWFAPNEDGWGLGITEQNGELFATWYTYDANGKPTWFVMPAGAWDGNTYSGDIYSTVGTPWVAATYSPAALVVNKVGRLALTFTDSDSLVMTYTLNGVSQTKILNRQPF